MPAPDDRDFSGYRIIRPLELGQRASVWEAEDLASGGTVAIETIVGEQARDPDVREWFAEAWEAVAELQHPNLVRVVRIGEQEGVPYVVRASAGGQTLARRLGIRGPLDPEDAVALLGQIGGALGVAHEAGVVHGTLGTDSVVVEDFDGGTRATLSGFGRAEGDRREDVRELGAILGAMVGARGAGAAGDDEAGEDDAVDERVVALEAVAATASRDGYRTAPELAAAAEDAIGGRVEEASLIPAGATSLDADTGADTGAHDADDPEPRRSGLLGWGLVLAGLVAVIVIGVSLFGGDDEGDDETAAISATTTSAETTETTPTEPTTSTEPSGSSGEMPAPIVVEGFPVGVAARDETVYVVTRKSGELSGYDQASGERTLEPVDLGGGAEDLTVVDGVAWATLPDLGAVARVDLAAAEPASQTIAVGAEPSGVVGALGSIWVVDAGSAELSRVPVGGGPSEAFPLDAEEPRGIAFGLGSLWVTDSAGTVIEVDPDDPADQRPFEVGADPRGVLVVDDHVWVADSGDGTVTELDPASGESREIEVGAAPREMAADPARLWVSNGAGYVSSIELDSDGVAEVDVSGPDGSPQSVAVGDFVWTTTGSGDSLVAVAPGE